MKRKREQYCPEYCITQEQLQRTDPEVKISLVNIYELNGMTSEAEGCVTIQGEVSVPLYVTVFSITMPLEWIYVYH
jgi:hypothetical protein